MGSRKQRIAGWILSGLLALFLIGPSAMGKFVEWEGKDKMLGDMGFSADLMMKIGVLEVTFAIIFLVPRSGFLGAILLTAYLGGATVTHLRLSEPIFMPIAIGVLVWIGLGLRRPEVFRLAIGAGSRPASGA